MKNIKYLLFGLLFIALPFERVLTFDVAGFTFKPSYLFAGLILFCCLFEALKNRKLNLSGSEYFILLFLVVSLFGVDWSLDPKRSFFLTLLYFLCVGLFISIQRLKDKKQIDKYFDYIIYVGIAASIFGFWQFFGDSFGLSQHFTLLRNEYIKGVFPFPRIQSTFLEPLYFANFLILPLYLSILRYIKTHEKRYLLFLFILGSALFLTLSRGALYGLIASGLILLVVSFAYYRENFGKIFQTAAILLVSFLFALGLIFVFSKTTGVRSFVGQTGKTADVVTTKYDENQVLSSREFTQKTALSHLGLLGIGTGSFGKLPEFQKILDSGNHQTVNNQYLEILVENGLIGLILFLAFWLSVVYWFFRQAIFEKKVDNLFFLSLIIAWLIQYLSFSSFSIIYLWVFLGLAYSPQAKAE